MSEQKIAFDDGASSILEVWGDRGPAIVCVHGMTSSRKSWIRLAQRLGNRYRVAAYDQRGHGDAHDTNGFMRLDQHVGDLDCAIRAVGGDVAALVGHSWGGAVVILGGRTLPTRAIVAVDPMLVVAPNSWRHEFLDDTEALLAKPWPNREQAVRQSLAGWHALDVDAKLHAIRHMTAEPIAKLGADNRADEGGWNIRDDVAKYPKPLLICVAGPDDSVLSRDDVGFLRSAGGANVRLADFPDQGHNLHRTAFDQFAAEVENFLASL